MAARICEENKGKDGMFFLDLPINESNIYLFDTKFNYIRC